MSTILLLFLFVISVTATDTLNLFIFKRVDGFEFKVTSYTIEVIYGSNFSLICKMMRKSNEEAVNSHLIWRKKREKTKFSNLDDEFEYNIPGSNILNFTSVSVNDQGTYFCRSMKYGQFRKIQLVIKTAILKKSNHHFHKRDLNFSQILEENEKATKLWKEEQENKYNNYEESRGSSNRDSSRNTNSLSEDSTSDDTPLKVFYVFVAVVAMFVIIYVVTRCCTDTSQDQNTTSSSNSRPGRYRQYRSNVRIQQTGTNPGVCSHAACLEYQLEHHTQICLFDLGNAQGTNGFHSGVNQMVHGNSLDLPPTYQDTTANNSATGSTNNLNTVPDDGFSTRILNADNNDNSPLPPTYEDALVNIVLSEPPSYDTHNASQDYSRDNGGAAASNVAAGGNTGNDNSAGGNSDSGGGTGGDTGGGDSGGGGGDSGGGGGDSGGGGGDSGGGGGDD